MGQGIGRVPEAPAVGGDAGGRQPIGRYIGQQRRLRGIELEDLAARTRIPRRSLERLEAGAFDHSPDGFSRGFVRTVAEAIGLDPDDAVARMLPEPDPARRGSPRSARTLGVTAAVVAAALVALGVRQLATSLPAQPPRRAPGELPVRRDYVRALAEAQGIATARLRARDAALAPLPPPVAEPAPAEEAAPRPEAIARESAPPATAPAAAAPAPSIANAAPAVPAAAAPVVPAAPASPIAGAPPVPSSAEPPPASAPAPPANAPSDAETVAAAESAAAQGAPTESAAAPAESAPEESLEPTPARGDETEAPPVPDAEADD